ncbi:MAG: hypothetical protein K2Q34_06875 [Alphaproteobacteria bacterium]|nr:hypothetical protein [Alphaproteobacteria bacterium]
MHNYLKISLLIFIVATQCFAGNVRNVKELSDYYGYRCDAYNSSEPTVTMKPITSSKSKAEALTDYTGSMNEFLHKVNQKRRASSDEKKLALQSIMGTALMYGETSYYARNNHLIDTPLFRHFEALRYAEALCSKYVLQIRTGKDETPDITRNYRSNLEKFSKVKAEVFDDWFAETLKQHGLGFTKTLPIMKGSGPQEELDQYIKGIKPVFLIAIADLYSKHIKPALKQIPRKKLDILITEADKIKALQDAQRKLVSIHTKLDEINEEIARNTPSPSADTSEEEKMGEIVLMETEAKLSLSELRKQLEIENEIIEHLIKLTVNSEEKKKFGDTPIIRDGKELSSAQELLNLSKLDHQERAKRLKKLIQIKRGNKLENRKAELEAKKAELELEIRKLEVTTPKASDGKTSSSSIKFSKDVSGYLVDPNKPYHKTRELQIRLSLKETSG